MNASALRAFARTCGDEEEVCIEAAFPDAGGWTASSASHGAEVGEKDGMPKLRV